MKNKITLDIFVKYNKLLNDTNYLKNTLLSKLESDIIKDLITFYNLKDEDIDELSTTKIEGGDSKTIYEMLIRKLRRSVTNFPKKQGITKEFLKDIDKEYLLKIFDSACLISDIIKEYFEDNEIKNDNKINNTNEIKNDNFNNLIDKFTNDINKCINKFSSKDSYPCGKKTNKDTKILDENEDKNEDENKEYDIYEKFEDINQIRICDLSKELRNNFAKKRGFSSYKNMIKVRPDLEFQSILPRII
tara:strand:+ start:670 stop:1407 length:738 start_codon:yes stop_codon:yes gene_type:complete